MSTPIVTIFVRHRRGCKYAGEEFEKRCNCRKHLRWSHNSKQYRKTAGTRSWAQAEEAKRNLEAQLSGKAPASGELLTDAQSLTDAIEVFLQDKRNQGVTDKVMGKYTRELARLREFCESRSVFTVKGLTRELLTHYCATWLEVYPASLTRAKVRERLRSFLRYCFEAEWLNRIPQLSKIEVDQTPTLPLTDAEYTRLLDTIYATFPEPNKAARVHALVQLMRWSGLAIRDALTLKREEIVHDNAKGLYRIVTSRQKTGTHVSVPIPVEVAKELLEVLNGNLVYVFWSGNGAEESVTKNWAKFIARLFHDAGLDGGYMKSHRLRDTFAVDLLQKGVPLEEVSKLLGHESIKTTEKHYAKWVKGRQDRLDSLVTGTWEQGS
jgi:integrase/recombinase XerD